MGATEREKMLAGELYRASDRQLVALRERARALFGLYNATGADETARRQALLGELFGKVGPTAEIEPPFFCDYGSQIEAGDRLYLNTGCVILDCCPVRLGENVLCGPNVHIYTATHPTDPRLRWEGYECALPVEIGDNVWLGGGAIVCPGVTIGSNAVIGAGSVVVKNIPANVVAVGNPCRVVRQLDSEPP
ncbi:sugar O-acetyltransferase [Gloeobacter kilaueensis]|uniref:Acetyltransferase n=1 Tax=Gloeobacter kilaueensis (strain ATCC BAA-2537 / CCAP 1431/1 / ULC 316 / JS1) TaxID=1183438 RepID=U5QJJ3_GLOK1|nr:maltose O-acetyltransferase [Gloeobacter kilaueensis JS1]